MYLRTVRSATPRRGNVLLLTCLCLSTILILTALAIDSGVEMSQRRQAQNCCDAAALTGCIQLAKLNAAGSTPTHQNIVDAVTLSATHNNFTTGTNCTITVNSPPLSGTFLDANSVEVLLTFTYNNMVTSGNNSVVVRSVASCGTGQTPSFPILLLDQTGANSFWVNSGKFTLANATVVVNSNNANAAVVDGSVNSAANLSLRTVGGSTGTFTPVTKLTATPLPDPYALLPAPSTSGMTTYTKSTYSPDSNTTTVLNPGYYPNGLYISSGNVTFNPGVYYISSGNCWINTPGTVTGTGVTLYHAGADANAQLKTAYGLDVGFCLCPTNGNYTITAPTTGPYAGISLFQSRTYVGEAFYDFWGTGSLNVGIQYFPDGTLRCWTGTGGGTINCNELVSKDFKLTGTHEIYGNTQNGGFSKLTWNAPRAANRPPTNVYLAE